MWSYLLLAKSLTPLSYSLFWSQEGSKLFRLLIDHRSVAVQFVDSFKQKWRTWCRLLINLWFMKWKQKKEKWIENYRELNPSHCWFVLSDTVILLIVKGRSSTGYAGWVQGLSSGGFSMCCGPWQQFFFFFFFFSPLCGNLLPIWT